VNRRTLLRAIFVLPSLFAMSCCAFGQARIPVAQVFVALADNQHQGIVPVPPQLGNGDAPASNLYWGAAFGVKTYFCSSKDWELVYAGSAPNSAVLERCIFRYRAHPIYLVADAYRGSEIRQAVTDFLSAAAGRNSQSLPVRTSNQTVVLKIGGAADLLAYVGHDAFMDFRIPPISGTNANGRPVIVLACESKYFFAPYLKETGATPLLWTTGLMAPEAYTLRAAIDSWIAGANPQEIREHAAAAYDKYQHCGLNAALHLFTTGW
jgi:hypothetical protein